MPAALTRVEFDLAGEGVWTAAVTDHVIGNIGLREGRNIARLGGPDIPSQCSAVTLFLSNADGYYTTGAGSELGPGSRVRLRWRATEFNSWETRFVGRLSELTFGFNGASFARTRWVGPLYRFTSGNIPGRLILNQTPQSIMAVLADAAGIPDAARQFDTEATLYNRQLSPGYVGVQEAQAMVRGFIHDTPDGRVRMELPPTRAAKSTVARYTDGDPTAAEIGVPPPRQLTRPFGIINAVEGQYQYYTPATNTGSSESVVFSEAEVGTNFDGALIDRWISFQRAQTLGFTPSPNVSTSGQSVTFSLHQFVSGDEITTLTVTGATGSRLLPVVGNATLRLEVRNVAFNVVGNTLCLTGEWRLARVSGVTAIVVKMRVNASVTVSDTVSFEQTVRTFSRELQDGESVERYGYRARQTPLVIGLFQATPLADDFTPNYTELDAAMQVELDTYATAIPVFEISLSTATIDSRTDILARRLSDRVRLTADGPSQLGFDDDGFIEAMQTTIDPTGNIAQLIYIQQTRLPPVVSNLALGAQPALTMTQGVAFSVTLPMATGGTPPYAYSVTGQPQGLTFNVNTRVLSGTPT